ncbi:MAG: hypothetical protein M3N22_08305 [Acidobacteriota bacterium]|nr:hypothetical protein [Acidobacteriota bacterium]
MARWILICRKCEEAFTHSTIDDTGIANYFMPKKPDLPGGAEFECPNCGHSATYNQADLRYQRQQ